MFAKLTGKLDSVGTDTCVLDVNGVGYLLTCSTRTLAALPPPGGALALLVETQVREDAIALYGFMDPAERAWFRMLVTVQGVGAKVVMRGSARGCVAARQRSHAGRHWTRKYPE